MRASMENPLVLFATAIGGFILAVLLLFLMVGGGFFLALLVLALLPVALAVLAVESISHGKLVEVVGAVPAPTPIPTAAPSLGRFIPLGIAGALALLGVYSGLMIAIQSWSHLVGDIGQHGFLLLLVLGGFGTLIGVVNIFAAQHALQKQGVLLAVAGTFVATLALQSCCLVPLTYWVLGVPSVLSTLAVALYINEVPVAVLGIIANAVGIAWVIALSRQAEPLSVAA